MVRRQRTPTLDDASLRRLADRRHPGAARPGRARRDLLLVHAGASARRRSSPRPACSSSRPTASPAWSSTATARRSPRLDDLPVNQSYPSGHVAASVAVYGGLALLISSRCRRRWVTVVVWTLAVAAAGRSSPLSRLYRGMHHLDRRRRRRARRHRRAADRLLAARACDAAVRRRATHRHGGDAMKRVAVIAHSGKTLGRRARRAPPRARRLRHHRPDWREVPKSRKAPEAGAAARSKRGAELVIVWGGDGMVQRCVDVLAGTKATARRSSRPGRPTCSPRTSASRRTSKAAVAIALGRRPAEARRRPDQRRGRSPSWPAPGFDARMIGAADGPLKDRFGRLAYVWTGAKNVRVKPFEAKIDGRRQEAGSAARRAASWSATWASCSAASRRSRTRDPTTARWRSGVVTADGAVAWMRTIARAAIDTAAASPYTETTTAREEIRIRLDRKVPYEIDGGDRTKVEGPADQRRSPARSASACPARRSQSRPDSRRVCSSESAGPSSSSPPLRRDGDARRRARRASAPRSSCRTSGRARRARSRRCGATPAARASRRVMRSVSHVWSTLIDAPLARLTAGCGTASRRPGRRGSPGRAPRSTSAT